MRIVHFKSKLLKIGKIFPIFNSVLIKYNDITRRCFFCGSFLLDMLHVGVCCDVVSVLCSLVVTCWERSDLKAVVCVVFVTFPNVSWSTSESRARMAP